MSLPLGKEKWLKANPDANAVFELEERTGNKITTKLWNFFHLVKRVKEGIDKGALPTKWNGQRVYACCNNCGDIVVVASKDPKSGKPVNWRNIGMVEHLASKKHRTTVEKLVELTESVNNKKRKAQTQTQTTLSGFEIAETNHTTGTVNIPLKLRQKKQDLTTVKFIIDCMIPFNIVEEESFRDMISSFNPHAKVMSSNKVENIIVSLETAMRDAAIEAIKGHTVCLTLDHWTSTAHHNYTGITAHFIDDDWKRHSMPVGVFLHEGGTAAIEHASSFVDLCLNNVKLNNVKIFAITIDTTTNMNSFGTKLERMGIAHMYNTDQVFQRTCKLCYTEEADMFGEAFAVSVKRAKAIVTSFCTSTQAAEKLLTKQEVVASCQGGPKGVVVDDVVTRWWSTFDMISRLLELKPAIQSLAVDGQLDGVVHLTPCDWENLHNITLVLKPFKDVQKLLECEKYVSASLVSHAVRYIKKKLKALSESNQRDNACKVLAEILLHDFEERWPGSSLFSTNVQRACVNRQVGIHPYLLIATFLDPRTKSLASVSDETTRTAIKDWVLELMMKSETELHANIDGTNAAAPCVAADEAKPYDVDEDDLFAGMQEDMAASEVDMQTGPDSDSVAGACANELRRYVATQSLSMRTKVQGIVDYNDPLQWWRQNQGLFPILAKLARFYLAVQGTSATSARISGLASRLIAAMDTSMDTNIASKVLYVYENWELFEEYIDFMEVEFDE